MMLISSIPPQGSRAEDVILNVTFRGGALGTRFNHENTDLINGLVH